MIAQTSEGAPSAVCIWQDIESATYPINNNDIQ